MAKTAVTISTFPNKLTITLRNENAENIMPKQSHHIIINNSKFAEYKMLFTLPIKIIPLPLARFGDVPRAVPLPSLRAASACRPKKAHRYLPAKR
jgi:hypothetical protein